METVRSFLSSTDEEFTRLVERLNSPWVVFDNDACGNATVIRVNSNKDHMILLKVVQVITDLNLIIKKAYIASEGGWFMDVFNVTDHDGCKITDKRVLDHIKDALDPDSIRSVGLNPNTGYTTIELIGTDRPGLLSDVSAVLTDLGCNIVSGEVWTHNCRAASIIHFTDADTGSAISDSARLSNIKNSIGNILDTAVPSGPHHHHPARRLHQMMAGDRDFQPSDQNELSGDDDAKRLPWVKIDHSWRDKNYTLVKIRSVDRPKLLFDTVCTLTDMGYMVFHANINAESSEAYQEYFIRHRDGQQIKTDAESQRLMQCLQAAIRRRSSEGLKLELCTTDRVGLLTDVTRIFRENGLTLGRAEVTTNGDKVVNTFYVRNALGLPIDSKTIETVRESIGNNVLQVKGNTEDKTKPVESPKRSLLSGLFSNFNLLRPCSSRRIEIPQISIKPEGVFGFQMDMNVMDGE